MSGDFLGPSTENKKKANLVKQRINNWLPPPDQGRFQDNFEKNAHAMITRIRQLLLPKGWIVGVDESSGVEYYYNESTQESRWDRPQSLETTETTNRKGKRRSV